jgi:hypothetical protein
MRRGPDCHTEAGERARGPHRGGGGGEPGGVLVARLYALEWGPAATVRGAGPGVLYTVWAWHRLDLHGDTCGLSLGNFVNKIYDI